MVPMLLLGFAAATAARSEEKTTNTSPTTRHDTMSCAFAAGSAFNEDVAKTRCNAKCKAAGKPAGGYLTDCTVNPLTHGCAAHAAHDESIAKCDSSDCWFSSRECCCHNPRYYCTATDVVGHWKYIQTLSGTLSITTTVGTNLKHSHNMDVYMNADAWSLSVNQKLEEGYKAMSAGGVKPMGPHDGWEAVESFSDMWSKSSEKTVQRTLGTKYRGKAMWQWQFSIKDTCGATTITKTNDLAFTPNRAEPPCCLPGYAENEFQRSCFSNATMMPGGAKNGCTIFEHHMQIRDLSGTARASEKTAGADAQRNLDAPQTKGYNKSVLELGGFGFFLAVSMVLFSFTYRGRRAEGIAGGQTYGTV